MTSLETFWRYMYDDIFSGNDFMFYAIVSLAWTIVIFFGSSGLFMVVDATGKPEWVLKYKIQPSVNPAPMDRQKLKRAVIVALQNQFLISGPLVLALYPVRQYMGCSNRPEDLPPGWIVLRDLLACVAVEEVGFYYGHRLSHWSPIYKRVHKMHHEWIAPIGITAVYCHPLEHLFVNLVPFVGGCVMMGSHMYTTLIWYAIGLIGTVLGHCNYHLPFMLSPESHDFHHSKFNVNYGSIGFLDWLHGTRDPFYKSKAYQRHKILLGLTPMREQIPD